MKALLILLLILPQGIFAQQAGLKLYDVNDGLPGSFVYRTYQDKNGYLWIATTAGVSRFDGRQFVNYSLADGLLSLKADAIFEDSQNRLWFGTNAGIAQFKNNRFIYSPTNDHLILNGTLNFFETNHGLLWACTSKGVYQFEGTVWKKISLYPGLDDVGCRNIIEKNGELFCNYQDDIVCRHKDGKWVHIASAREYGAIFNFMSLQGDLIWVSTSNYIYTIEGDRLVPLRKNTDGNYFTSMIDSKNRLWIGENNLIRRSAPKDLTHLTDSIVDPGPHFLMNEDSAHSIWTGKINGLLKIKDINFSIVEKNGTTPLQDIENIIVLPGDSLLVSSSSQAGLQVYTDHKFKPLSSAGSFGKNNGSDGPVISYTFDEHHLLWILTDQRRLLTFDGQHLQDLSPIMHLQKTAPVYDLNFIAKRRKLFICADSTLLYVEMHKTSTFIPRNTGVPIPKPTHVQGLKNGLIVAYLEGKGVYGIDEQDNLISLVKQTGINGYNRGNNLELSFYEDPTNFFWIAFPGLGLFEYGFKKDKLPFLKAHLTISDGLQSNKVITLVMDRQNRIWALGNAGLDILQINKAGYWEVFNYARSGDLGISLTGFEKLARDDLGNIWLSSPGKIIKFNTAAVRLRKAPPRVVIEKVSLAFKETDWSKWSDSLYSYFQLPFCPILGHNQNSLAILFDAIDLSTSNSSPEYCYKLLPLDTAWSIPARTRSVSLAQLPAGSYKFIVRARDRASGWSKAAFFTFSIRPPFWSMWWFRIIVLIIASLIIVRIFKARVKKIRSAALIENQLKELEMKALKAQMNPHFIYNALNSIQALVADDKKAEGIHYIGSFSRLLRQVLDQSENNVISLNKELETIELYIQLESLRLDMKLGYHTVISKDIVTEFEKIPPLILQPFVENALWHGLSNKIGEKEIRIAVSTDKQWLTCEIRDNGIGRKASDTLKSHAVNLHQSKGLDITCKRLIDFNGDNEVTPVEFFDLCDEYNNPSGTLVRVRIKRKSKTVRS